MCQVVRIGNNEVLLEWYNPPFAGVPPTKYRVYMRNKSRNFNTWKLVYYPGDILKTQFLVRDLPMGVGCQFRVSACNNAGWSKLSQETIYVTPGEENEQISVEARWRRIQQGGILATLDHMEQLCKNSDEQRRGLHMLLCFGQANIGFKNSAMALKVAAAAIAAIKTFDLDPEITALSYNVLGWCLKGKGERKTRAYCMQNNLLELVQQSTTHYRYQSNVMNAIAWLRNTLSKYLPPPQEPGNYVPLNPQPKVKNEHGAHDDNEEEEEEEIEYILDGEDEEEAKH